DEVDGTDRVDEDVRIGHARSRRKAASTVPDLGAGIGPAGSVEVDIGALHGDISAHVALRGRSAVPDFGVAHCPRSTGQGDIAPGLNPHETGTITGGLGPAVADLNVGVGTASAI